MSTQPIAYRIDLSEATSHRFLVSLQFTPADTSTTLSLPVWIPGSYLVREFARHLNKLQANQAGRACDITQVDKATWALACQPGKTVNVQYEVYAFDTSVRAAYLDANRGFINNTSLCLRVHGQEEQSHHLHIEQLPKDWDVATAMLPLPAARKPGKSSKSTRSFQAASYDELLDHPLELGTFWRRQFIARGVPHEFVVAGAAPSADLERLVRDAQRICITEIDFWHGRKKPAFDRYVFMLNVVDDGYGGLEHRNSTALICSRRDLPRLDQKESSDGYVTLLGLISHEYFHTWNVKRLKPREFAPYDYSQENYTRMLWFFEGFTSYFDDAILLRAGLINAQTYLKLLNKTLNQVLATPGRHMQSVAQASFDAWLRLYRPDENTANTTVSYYSKGALVALALDLSLRTLNNTNSSASKASLAGVMRRLWALQRPIEGADVAQALQDEAGGPPPSHAGHATHADWQSLLSHWVHGTDDLPLQSLLQQMGVQWELAQASLSQRLGVRLKETPQGLQVSAVMRGSPAEAAGMAAGDELLALDGWRLKRPDDWQTLMGTPSLKPLLVSRDQRILSLSLPILDKAPTAWCQLVNLSMPQATGPSLKRRKGWLGC